MTVSAPSLLRRIVLPAVFVAFAGILLFARAVDRDLNHDEHQFLAPGALLARQGAEPYKDYPLFHLPNLVFVYAGLAKMTDHYILAAKCLSALATTIVAAVLLLRAAGRPAFGSWQWSLPVALAATTLLLFDPLFLRTTGKTWNHEFPVCLVVLAFCCHVAAARRGSMFHVVASGALVSFAVGTRLTLLPLIFPFFAGIWFFPSLSIRRRLALAGAFGLAGFIAMAPSLYYYWTAHDEFVFGNFEFPRLRLIDPSDTRAAETASAWRKVRYFLKEVVMLDREKDGTVNGSMLLIGSVIALAVAPAFGWWHHGRSTQSIGEDGGMKTKGFSLTLAVIILPFAVVGCALPTRYQYQHWFALAPFLALALVEASAYADVRGTKSWKPALLVACSMMAVFLNPRVYVEPVKQLASPSEWYPIRMHDMAKAIRSHITDGKVLTLAPTWLSEAGVPFYPEFATGPFAWRLAHLLDPAKADRFHMVSPSGLQTFLESDPPAGILTGVEDEELEAPLVVYAQAQGYHRVKLAKRRVFWVRP